MRDVLSAATTSSPENVTLSGIRDAIIIYNPTSGRRRARRLHELNEVAAALKLSGIEARLLPTTCAGSATELAREAVSQNCQLVIACGGDGTINEIVNGLAGSQVPLAVLPAGTANVLAKELEIPWDIVRAARQIANGRLQRIALGEILWHEQRPEGPAVPLRRYFLCVGGAGPDGAIVHAVDVGRKLRIGILAYWEQGFRQFLRYKFPLFHVTSAEKTLDTSLLVVGRTKHYGGPFRITTGASLLENEFEVVAYAGRNRASVLACWPAMWLNSLRHVPGIHIWKTSHLRCEPLAPGAGEPIYSQIDGEGASALPLEFRIVPDALTLVFPRGSRTTFRSEK